MLVQVPPVEPSPTFITAFQEGVLSAYLAYRHTITIYITLTGGERQRVACQSTIYLSEGSGYLWMSNWAEPDPMFLYESGAMGKLGVGWINPGLGTPETGCLELGCMPTPVVSS